MCIGLFQSVKKDTSEVLQDGDIPDVVVERVHGIMTGEKKRMIFRDAHRCCSLLLDVSSCSIPVLLLKSFECRHVVHLAKKLTENSDLVRGSAQTNVKNLVQET